MQVLISLSAVKLTPVLLAAAVRSDEQISKALKTITLKIRALKKKALQNYLKRKKADAAKAANKKGNKSQSSFEDQLEIQEIEEALAAGETVSTPASKKERAKNLKQNLKSNPKAALRKKQMSAAMRIRENREIKAELKPLLEKRKYLQDRAWAKYVKNAGTKKASGDKLESSKDRLRSDAVLIGDRYKLGSTNQVKVPKLSKALHTKAVTKLAGSLHSQWQQEYKAANGPDAKRIKKTKDEAWIKANGGKDEVDIANTDFDKLPSDWKKENAEAAKAAVTAVVALNKSGAMNANSLEKASNHVHKKWLERNGSWAPENQKLPFNELSQEEADKDRAHVTHAIKVMRDLAPTKQKSSTSSNQNVSESGWFDKLSSAAKEKYLSLHPESQFSKDKKVRVKGSSGPGGAIKYMVED